MKRSVPVAVCGGLLLTVASPALGSNPQPARNPIGGGIGVSPLALADGSSVALIDGSQVATAPSDSADGSTITGGPVPTQKTKIKGFKSGVKTTESGRMHTDRLRVIGGAPRGVQLQYRAQSGRRWQVAQEVSTSENGRTKVSMIVNADRRHWRVVVPVAGDYRQASSAVRRFRVKESQTVTPMPDLSTVTGSQIEASKLYARMYIQNTFGWGDDQWLALEALWTRESGWNHLAVNSSSGATGIPQALPGDKMATAGADWATNPYTQIRWGVAYIQSRYGTPASAWDFWQSNNWY